MSDELTHRITAHRGGAGYAPENTMGGFLRTLQVGSAQWIDFDVQRTRDGELVVMHDLRLGRTSDVREVYPGRVDDTVGDFTLEELRRLDIGSWFRPGDYRGETVATFDEALDALSRRIGITFELKHPRLYAGLEQQVAEALRRHGLASSPDVRIASFEPDSLLRMRTALPSARLCGAFRSAADLRDTPLRGAISSASFAPHYSAEELELAAGYGLASAAGMNSVARMRGAIDDGIRHLSSDYPDVLRRVIDGHDAFDHARDVTIVDVDVDLASGTRTARVRNEGASAADLHDWYLWNGVATELGETPLAPGEEITLTLALPRAPDVSSIQTLALHDGSNRLRDLAEYWAVPRPAEFAAI
jgi:glycerophosphoryl diester phosphodiesterase